METFVVVVTDNCDIISSPDFSFTKCYSNSELLEEFDDEYVSIINQMELDVPRQDIYEGDNKLKNLEDVLLYISLSKYLKKFQMHVYLMLSQTILSIPVIILFNICGNINPDLVVSENGYRTIIKMSPTQISVEKKLIASMPISGEIEKKIEFYIFINTDFEKGNTIFHINGNKLHY